MKKINFKDVIIIIGCLSASTLLLGNVIPAYTQVKEQQQQLSKDIEAASEENTDLTNSLTQSQSSNATEQGVAREKFHMSNDDELIFVFPDNA